MSTLFSCTFLFLFCALNPAALISWMKKKDIHSLGSKNPGSTNAYRIFGPKIAACVFFFDYLKPIVALYCTQIFIGPASQKTLFLFPLFSVAGHCFSPFLKFQGGKGIATYFGSLLAISPIGSFSALALWGLSYLFSRRSWKSSLISCALLILILPKHIAAACLLPTLLIFLRHRENIKQMF